MTKTDLEADLTELRQSVENIRRAFDAAESENATLTAERDEAGRQLIEARAAFIEAVAAAHAVNLELKQHLAAAAVAVENAIAVFDRVPPRTIAQDSYYDHATTILLCARAALSSQPAAGEQALAAPTAPGKSSLWTTPARVGQPPLEEARVDPTVTKEDVQRAIDKGRGSGRS